MAVPLRDALRYPADSRAFLEPHLPPPAPTEPQESSADSRPFTTVTFATSLDSQLALQPGAPTALSGPVSKAMTHYLRSRHEAILIGVGTAVADNPSLNCRTEGVGGYGGEGLHGQPRPIVVDPTLRWDFTEDHKIFRLARSGRGRAPFIITGVSPPPEKRSLLAAHGGKFVVLEAVSGRLDWSDILLALGAEGLRSVMVEGGAGVINALLSPENSHLVSSVIVTIAPTWLGVGGVVVSPPRRTDTDGNPVAAARLHQVTWHPLGDDVVLCGRMKP